ncbi:MAG: hypothetical protein EOQ41_03065 [Mesorhizobium sp.]|uniref:hypothetical protein n=1 Tax=Mesorhizobium sp. TaxID=1871066 RepID=UPI000FE85A6F|nr:hypothetical protein [Mesorhizobium sp.]RWB35806.1 MAG: hypothetical protein EOQ41_03065 [Mesorhizobium sp.]
MEISKLAAADATRLLEVRDRWRELILIDRAQVTPFSQTGIEVIAQGLERLYASPAESRNQQLDELRSGIVARLLPADLLAQYCTETALLDADISAGGSGRIKAELSAEIVHAAPVLTALRTELPALLTRLDAIPERTHEKVLSELRTSLLDAIGLRKARAALELIASPDGANMTSPAIAFIRAALERAAPLADLLERLPSPLLGEVRLCQPDTSSWPPLPVVDTATRENWKRVSVAFDDFFTRTEAALKAILERAEAVATGLPPLKTVVEPVLDQPRSAVELTTKWRVAFEFTPGPSGGSSGKVNLVALNEKLRLAVPLGVPISRAGLQELAGGVVKLSFQPDAFLQSASVDLEAMQSALGSIGLPDWVRIDAAELLVEDDFRKVEVGLQLRVPAVGVDLPYTMPLHDGAKAVDFDTEFKLLADSLAAALKAKFQKSVPQIATGWGLVDLQVVDIVARREIQNRPWDITISAKLRSPFDGLGLVAVSLRLGTEAASPYRLLSATIDPDSEVRILNLVDGTFDVILSKIEKIPDVPTDARYYLKRCLALEGSELREKTAGGRLGFALKLLAGGKPRQLEVTTSDDAKVLGQALLAIVAQDVTTCVLEEWALYQARSALGLTPQQISDYLAQLNELSINVLGVSLELANVQPPAGKRGFVFDLIQKSAANQIKIGQLALRLEKWQLGAPLTVEAIDFSAANVTPKDMRSLLLAVTGLPEPLLQQVDVALNGGVFRVTPHLTIPALGGQISVPPIDLTPQMTAADVRERLFAAANSVVGQLIAQEIGRLLPDLGSVESVTLDKENSLFLPVDGKDAIVAFQLLSNLKYFKVTWRIVIAIDSQGHSSIAIEKGDAAEQIEANLVGYLNDALMGIAPGKVTNIEAMTSAPYGVAFDVGADVGGFQVTLEGVRVTSKGLQLSSLLKLEYRQPPAIPLTPFQALPVEINIDLQDLANFSIRAFITVQGDDEGVVGLDAGLRGKGSEKRLETEAVIKILRDLSLVKSTGVVDFGNNTIVMRTETVGELSKLIDIGEEITLSAKPAQAKIAAKMDVLGITANGHLVVGVDGKNAKVALGGDADLLLGKATVDAVLDAKLRGVGASGSINTFVGSARLTVTPATAQAELNVHGFRIKLIAPSVNQLTKGMLEEALRRLFDFKFSWDNIKNREIVISLVDPGGRINNDPVGGDPIDRKAPDQNIPESKDDKSPPPPVNDSGKGGDADNQGQAPGGCRLPDSSMIKSPSKFPDHVVEMTGPVDNTYFYYHESRVAPIGVWNTLKSLHQIACFTLSNLDYPYFAPEGFEVWSPYVQVFVGPDGQALVMVWRKDQQLVPLPIDPLIRAVLFNGVDQAQLFEAARTGLVVEGFAKRVLQLLVVQVINAPKSERLIDLARVTPNVLQGTGIAGVPGAIAKIDRGGQQLLRIMIGDGQKDDEILNRDPLFALLETSDQRRGPLGQLVVAAADAGKTLRVLHNETSCTLIVADAVNEAEWGDRLFAVTPDAIFPAVLVGAARTEDVIGAAGAGKIVCDTLLGGNGKPRWDALSGGDLENGTAALAFGRGLGTDEWHIRLAVLDMPTGGAPPDPPTYREGTSKEIETKLGAWVATGSIKDKGLRAQPLDHSAQQFLLDTLVLPEAKYLDRLQVNPRGLL